MLEKNDYGEHHHFGKYVQYTRSLLFSKLQKVFQAGNWRIRSVRREQSIPQEELAYRAGVARGYMSLIERGEANVSMLILLRIADTLQVPINRLFE